MVQKSTRASTKKGARKKGGSERETSSFAQGRNGEEEVVGNAEASSSAKKRKTGEEEVMKGKSSLEASKNPTTGGEEVLARFPLTGPQTVELKHVDIGRLEPGKELKDKIIQFGLCVLHNNVKVLDLELGNSIYIFSFFFFSSFPQKAQSVMSKEEHGKLVRWKAPSDLFRMRYHLVVPVNSRGHWYLLIVVDPAAMLPEAAQAVSVSRDAPLATCLDSLGGRGQAPCKLPCTRCD